MYQFDIEYSTQNQYENPVKEALYEFNVIPYEDETLRIKHEEFWNNIKKPGFRVENTFGFTGYRIRIDKPITSFDFIYKCTVIRQKENPYDFPLLTLEEEIETQTKESSVFGLYFYLKPTYSTRLEKNKGFKKKGDSQTTFDFLMELNKFLHTSITFDTKASSLEKTPDDTIKDSSGVCQDFVNLFMAICRENNIPCRYASGYLHQGEGLQGDAQMHAWVEAYLPGVGWKGFDPTNNLLTDHHFIKVCHGYEYKDTAPIRGVLSTSGKNITNYAVQVSMQQ